jgi:hypothetical protein
MTFDGTLDPIVGYNGSIGESAISGTPVYDAGVWRPYVVEYGNGNAPVRAGENRYCIKANKAQVVKPILHPYMTHDDSLDSATIEFFMKGSTVDADVTGWKTKLSLGRNLSMGRYGLLLQVDDQAAYYKHCYVRVDTDYSVDGKFTSVSRSPFAITDGKWHHIAITIEPLEDGARTRVTYYFDYGDPVVTEVAGRWLGMRHGNELTIGEATSLLWYDEIRVSKGVLPKARFLKQKSAGGLTVSVR